MINNKFMVLVVAYNAQNTIINLLHRFPKEVWEKASEIVIADDASKDNTAHVAEDYKGAHNIKNLTIVKHKINKGYGGNQKWGYNYAIKKGYEAVVMVHGDAQYPPEKIIELVSLIFDEKKDFAFGSRMSGHPLKGGMPLYKFFGNIFLTTIENIALFTNLSEFHSGFRAYSTQALKDIPFNLNSDDFHFDSQIIIQMVAAKKKIGEMTIPTFYGDEKCNVRVISYGLNVLKEIAKFLLHKTGLRYCKNYEIKKNNL